MLNFLISNISRRNRWIILIWGIQTAICWYYCFSWVQLGIPRKVNINPKIISLEQKITFVIKIISMKIWVVYYCPTEIIKFLYLSYTPKSCLSIKLQDSLIYNIKRGIQFLACLELSKKELTLTSLGVVKWSKQFPKGP